MRAPSSRAPSLALAGLVAAAAALLAVAGRGIPTPWILIDELLHSVLARGLAVGLIVLAQITIGHSAPGSGGGGRIVGGTTTTASKATLSTPPAPFRVEVRAPRGTRVAFGYSA